MSLVTPEPQLDPVLTAELLEHLDLQLESARRMLDIVQEQGLAIRQRDVHNVVRLACALQVEMHRSEALEHDRIRLLAQAAAQLALSPSELSLTQLETVMEFGAAKIAGAHGAILRDTLAEIEREHECNRLLMRQELSFLEHLLRLAGSGAYDAGGDLAARRGANAHTRRRLLDVDA